MKAMVTFLFLLFCSFNSIAQTIINETPTELLLKASLHGNVQDIKKSNGSRS